MERIVEKEAFLRLKTKVLCKARYRISLKADIRRAYNEGDITPQELFELSALMFNEDLVFDENQIISQIDEIDRLIIKNMWNEIHEYKAIKHPISAEIYNKVNELRIKLRDYDNYESVWIGRGYMPFFDLGQIVDDKIEAEVKSNFQKYKKSIIDKIVDHSKEDNYELWTGNISEGLVKQYLEYFELKNQDNLTNEQQEQLHNLEENLVDIKSREHFFDKAYIAKLLVSGAIHPITEDKKFFNNLYVYKLGAYDMITADKNRRLGKHVDKIKKSPRIVEKTIKPESLYELFDVKLKEVPIDDRDVMIDIFLRMEDFDIDTKLNLLRSLV